MSYYQKGRAEGRKKKTPKTPKADGFFGTTLCQSDTSKQRRESYSKGHEKGSKESRSGLGKLLGW